ncbi:hypothetical protein PVL29_008031 [Vitis rotundifolia]|uniref:glucan endo-1,3-beta-D-glucosidase n=1 Tax=Vitis rotundifolia TaxID=103349 RepID=A0AA39A1H7_VITRO|nr:hypothetical protein PVL29_008031 [Vitis rotundifolia]
MTLLCFLPWPNREMVQYTKKPAAQSVGVCYGTLGDNLPSATEVVQLCQRRGIEKMRIFEPNPATLQALRGSGIRLILGVPNVSLQDLASTPNAATDWIKSNVVTYASDVDIWCIAVGNEVSPTSAATSQFAQYVLPAMQNIQSALVAAGLGQIKVSTASSSELLGSSYPPSQGAFSDGASSFINPIIGFLVNNNSTFLANVYPYFAHIGDPANVQLSYALFTSPGVVVQDGQHGYQNLFDAMVDGFYAALEKAGGTALDIVVSESGWPSDGGLAATTENAKTYYTNLVYHAMAGTPKRPDKALDTYLFALFDENQKAGPESERHFGLFFPNEVPKY